MEGRGGVTLVYENSWGVSNDLLLEWEFLLSARTIASLLLSDGSHWAGRKRVLALSEQHRGRCYCGIWGRYLIQGLWEWLPSEGWPEKADARRGGEEQDMQTDPVLCFCVRFHIKNLGQKSVWIFFMKRLFQAFARTLHSFWAGHYSGIWGSFTDLLADYQSLFHDLSHTCFLSLNLGRQRYASCCSLSEYEETLQ